MLSQCCIYLHIRHGSISSKQQHKTETQDQNTSKFSVNFTKHFVESLASFKYCLTSSKPFDAPKKSLDKSTNRILNNNAYTRQKKCSIELKK